MLSAHHIASSARKKDGACLQILLLTSKSPCKGEPVGPQARRGPTIRDLEAAVTQVASTEAAMNQEGIKEAKWFRDAFIDHRDEIRKAFAATHELITHLHGEVKADIAGLRDEVRRNHATVMAQFEKLTTPD